MHDHGKTVLSSTEKVTEHPDLEVPLSFWKIFYISSIILKAKRIPATIKRSFEYLTEKILSSLQKFRAFSF